MSETKRMPKSTSGVGFGIVNPFGDMWTTDVFGTEEAARQHLANFWKHIPGEHNLRRYRIVRAMVTTDFVADLAKEEIDGRTG